MQVDNLIVFFTLTVCRCLYELKQCSKSIFSKQTHNWIVENKGGAEPVRLMLPRNGLEWVFHDLAPLCVY